MYKGQSISSGVNSANTGRIVGSRLSAAGSAALNRIRAASRAMDELSAQSHVSLGTKAHALRRTVRGLLERAGGDPAAIDAGLERAAKEKAAREAVAAWSEDKPRAMDQAAWLGVKPKGQTQDEWLGKPKGESLNEWLGVRPGTSLAAWIAKDSAEAPAESAAAEEGEEITDEQAAQLVEMFDQAGTVLEYAAQSGPHINSIQDGLAAIYTFLSKLIAKHRLTDYAPSGTATESNA